MRVSVLSCIILLASCQAWSQNKGDTLAMYLACFGGHQESTNPSKAFFETVDDARHQANRILAGGKDSVMVWKYNLVVYSKIERLPSSGFIQIVANPSDSTKNLYRIIANKVASPWSYDYVGATNVITMFTLRPKKEQAKYYLEKIEVMAFAGEPILYLK